MKNAEPPISRNEWNPKGKKSFTQMEQEILNREEAGKRVRKVKARVPIFGQDVEEGG